MTPEGAPFVPDMLWANHALLMAVPAVLPAIVVVGVVVYIARKDRQDEQQERELIERAFDKENE